MNIDFIVREEKFDSWEDFQTLALVEADLEIIQFLFSTS